MYVTLLHHHLHFHLLPNGSVLALNWCVALVHKTHRRKLINKWNKLWVPEEWVKSTATFTFHQYAGVRNIPQSLHLLVRVQRVQLPNWFTGVRFAMVSVHAVSPIGIYHYVEAGLFVDSFVSTSTAQFACLVVLCTFISTRLFFFFFLNY